MTNHFQKIINHRSETIFGAAMLTSGLVLMGSLLGILRNALLASRFGASGNLDIYYASFRFPDFIYNIFIMGAISAAFIPIFSEYWNKNKKEAWQFSSSIIVIIGAFVGSLALGISIFTRPILRHFLVGFSASQLEIAVVMTRIMMIQPVLMGISAVVGSVLKIFKLFLASALAPLLYNLGIIIGILFFVPVIGLKGLAYGVVLGALMHILIQLPALKETGYRWYFRWSFFQEVKLGLQKMWVIAVPRALAIITFQVFLLGITSIATMLKSGSLAIFNFASTIQNLPQTVFALSFAVAAFPSLAELNAKKKNSNFNIVAKDNFLQILFFLIPISLWFIIFREPIVRLLLGYGKFDWTATVNTIKVFSILSLGMIFQGANVFLLRIFFARKDSLRPFIASLVSYSLGLALCYYLARQGGLIGLTVGVTLTYFVCCLILTMSLAPFFSSPLKKKFIQSLGKIVAVALISGGVSFIILSLLNTVFTPAKVVYLMSTALLAFIPSFILFVFLCDKWKIKEIEGLKKIKKGYFYGRRSKE